MGLGIGQGPMGRMLYWAASCQAKPGSKRCFCGNERDLRSLENSAYSCNSHEPGKKGLVPRTMKVLRVYKAQLEGGLGYPKPALDVDGNGYAGQQTWQSQDGGARESHLHLPYYVSGELSVLAS